MTTPNTDRRIPVAILPGVSPDALDRFRALISAAYGNGAALAVVPVQKDGHAATALCVVAQQAGDMFAFTPLAFVFDPDHDTDLTGPQGEPLTHGGKPVAPRRELPTGLYL